MRQLSFATATLCLLLVVPPTTRAGQIIYDIQNYPADQNGHTLSGTITTDGVIGTLTSADIKAWTVTFDNTYTFRLSDVGSGTTVIGDVQATAQTITIGPAPSSGGSDFGMYSGPFPAYGNGVASVFYIRLNAPPYPLPEYEAGYPPISTAALLWDTLNPNMGGTEPWVIAVAPASAVPEPSSLWLLGTAISAGLAYGWSRHRRDQWRQRPVGPPGAPE